MQSNADCRLLALPPELRNHIYRYVLLGELEIIPATGPVPKHPAILSTCHIIRKEAVSIYLGEAERSFEVVDYDSTRLRRFCTLSKDHWKFQYTFKISGRPNWSNLLEWLETYSEEECHGFGLSAEQIAAGVGDRTDLLVAHYFFCLVDHMQDDMDGDWDQIRKGVEIAHACVAAANPVWA